MITLNSYSLHCYSSLGRNFLQSAVHGGVPIECMEVVLRPVAKQDFITEHLLISGENGLPGDEAGVDRANTIVFRGRYRRRTRRHVWDIGKGAK
jgi:hypothetical protein